MTKISEVLDAERLMDMAFAMSLEFGWTPNYIILQMPMRYFNGYASRLEDHYILQKEASEGKKSIPRSELTKERKAEKTRKLQACRESMQSARHTTCQQPSDVPH